MPTISSDACPEIVSIAAVRGHAIGGGFQGYTIPGYGTDPDGNQHDMIKMVLKL